MSVNQCDGCRRGLPLRGDLHYDPATGLCEIGCTRNLYRPNKCAACGHPLGLHEKNGCAWAVPGVLGWIPCMCKEGR